MDEFILTHVTWIHDLHFRRSQKFHHETFYLDEKIKTRLKQINQEKAFQSRFNNVTYGKKPERKNTQIEEIDYAKNRNDYYKS